MQRKTLTKMLVIVVILIIGLSNIDYTLAVDKIPDYIVTTKGGGTDGYYVLRNDNKLMIDYKTKFLDAVALCKTDLNGDGEIIIHFGNQGNDGNYNEILDIKPDMNTDTVIGPVTATYTGKLNIIETGFVAGSGLTIPNGVTVTLDGLILTNEAAKSNNITVWGTLNVKGTSEVKATNLESTRMMINNLGTVNVSGGTVHTELSRGINGGIINITGGEVSTNSSFITVQAVSGDNVTISGGTIYGKAEAMRVYDRATINGGTINSGNYGIILTSGNLTINSGTITASGVAINYNTGLNSQANINISGGTIKGATALYLTEKGTTNITGGTIEGTNNAVFIYDDSTSSDKANKINISGGTVSGGNSAVYLGNKSKSHATITGTAIVKSISSNSTISLYKSSVATSRGAYASIFGTKVYNSSDGTIDVTGNTGVTGHDSTHRVIQSDNYTSAKVTASYITTPNSFLAWLYSVSPEEILNRTNGVTLQVLEEELVNKNVDKNVYLKVGALTVKYDAQGGTVTPTSKNVVNGQTYGTLPTPTRADCVFGGWYTGINGSGDKVVANTFVSITDPSLEQTLYAKWSIKVSFNMNYAGGVAPSAKYVDPNSTYGSYLPTNGITRTGYTFNGWFTAAEGGTKVETTTKVSDINGNPHTLYAQWTANTYTVSFDSNGGSENPTSVSRAFGSAYEIPSAGNKIGYTFDGWYAESTNGTKVTSSSAVNIAKDHTLYARWKAIESTVTFIINGGSSDDIPTTFTSVYGSVYGQLPTVTPPNDKKFAGWYTTSSTESGILVTSTTTVTTTSAHTLYAIYSDLQVYSVSYNGNGHTSGTEPVGAAHYENTIVTVATNTGNLAKTGYGFKGWSTSSSGAVAGANVYVLEGGKISPPSFTINSDITLYAVWEPISVTVNFDVNAPLNTTSPTSVSNKTVTFGAPYGDAIETIERAGYKLLGWFTEQILPKSLIWNEDATANKDNEIDGWLTTNVDEYKVTRDTTLTKPSTHSLFAQWVAKRFRITYDTNEGSLVDATSGATAIYDKKYGQLKTATRDGYEFGGWFTTEGYEEESLVTNTTSVTAITAPTLYAKWTAKTDTPYSVEHYQQNVSGDGYTLLNFETNTGTTEQIVSAAAISYIGFTENTTHESRVTSAAILGNGSTKLKFYYDRDTYAIEFNSDGGSLVTSQSGIRHDATISKPSSPTKLGYTFVGWYKEPGLENVWNFSTDKVTATTTLYAKWAVYVPENNDDNDDDYQPPTEQINVNVETGKLGQEVINKTPIIRTTGVDGKKNDKVTFTPESAKDAIKSIKDMGQNIARVVIPDPKDEVASIDFTLPNDTHKQISDAKVNFEIYTENAKVMIPPSSLSSLDKDLYFRFIPIKEEPLRKEVEQRARVEKIVTDIAEGQKVNVVTRPMTIETNMQSRAVTLVFPLKDVVLQTNTAEREKYLSDLVIFIEHSDGEKELVKPQVVEYSIGMPGLQFGVNKFSTFTILNMEGYYAYLQTQAKHHKSYIKGYVDGTFKPEQSITRAEMAALLARNLNFDAAKTVLSSYPDLQATHWALKEIEFVKTTGLMTGDAKGTFRPDSPISRGEMAAIAARYKKLTTTSFTTSRFSDVEASYWGAAEIEAIRTIGIVDGYIDNTYKPHNSLSRSEAVKIVNRLFERGPLYGVSAPSWPDVQTTHWSYMEVEEASKSHNYLPRQVGGEDVIYLNNN